METDPRTLAHAPLALDSDPTVVMANLLPCHWVQGGGAVLANGILLTAREVDVVAGVSHGFRNREIANRLHLAESTVRSNVSHIRQKLGLNRIQLALLWDQMLRTARSPRPRLVSGAHPNKPAPTSTPPRQARNPPAETTAPPP